MRITTDLMATALIGVALSPAASHAAKVSNIFDISGPGGTGTEHYSLDDEFNQISLNFTSSDWIGFVGSLYIFDSEPKSFRIDHGGAIARIYNNTPDHWAGYQINFNYNSLNGYGAFGVSGFGDVFDTATKIDDTIVLSGGPGVSPSSSFELSIGIYSTDPAVISIYEKPLVPEPSSVALLAIGSLILGAFFMRQRSKRARAGGG